MPTAPKPQAQKVQYPAGNVLTSNVESGIIKTTEMFRKKGDSTGDFETHYISKKRIDQLTVEARKQGAMIIVDDPWFNSRMEEKNASAVTYGDIIAFGKNVTVSDVLEETYHFKQNLEKFNDDKSHELREVLNEIDAKKYLLSVADKYNIPRSETELTRKQLESYEMQLKELLEKEE